MRSANADFNKAVESYMVDAKGIWNGRQQGAISPQRPVRVFDPVSPHFDHFVVIIFGI